MKLRSIFPVETVLIVFFASPVSVNGTWSVIATDRATGQVGGAGATCRTWNGGSLLYGTDSDYRSVPGTGCLVGQAGTDDSDADRAKILMEGGATASAIVNSLGDSDDQWAAVFLNGDKDANSRSSEEISLDTTGQIKKEFTYSVQGNRLSSTKVVQNAEKEFKKGGKGKGGRHSGDFEKCDDLADRLMRAVEAGALNGEGDTRCTDNDLYSANTAYLKVENPDGTVAIEIDLTTVLGQDGIKELRNEYESKRGDHCKRRPRPHHHYLPLIGVAAIVAIGVIVKKKTHATIVAEDASVDTSLEKDGPGIDLQSQTPYVRDVLVQPPM